MQRSPSFGIVLPQGWRWLDDNGHTSTEQYRFSKAIAQLADKLSFSSAYAYDHMWGGSFSAQNRAKNFFECLVLLTSIITNTKKLKIGQLVLGNSYRNPSLLAKMVSTMDVISDGRIELGIGAGWIKDEYFAYGFEYTSALDRVKRLDESLCIIRKMWTESKSTFRGRYYSIMDAICNPKPIQKPYPKIMVGGTGDNLLKVVAKHADRYNHPFANPADIEQRLHHLKDYCVGIGRNYEEIEASVLVRCLIGNSHDDVHDVIKPYMKKDEKLEDFAKKNAAIIGTPDDIITEITRYKEIGISHFVIHFIGLNKDTLRLFDSKVIKKVR